MKKVFAMLLAVGLAGCAQTQLDRGQSVRKELITDLVMYDKDSTAWTVEKNLQKGV
jgi:hypothetical protein